MANDDQENYNCPLSGCTSGNVNYTLHQVLCHVLYHATIEMYYAEMQKDEDDRDNLQADLIEKFRQKDAIEFSDLTEHQVI